MEQQLIIIRNQVSGISSQPEEKRNTLFAIFTVLLLSKEVFKRNDDLRPFLKQCRIEYADYVFRSRTLLMARTLREIHAATSEQMELFEKAAKQVLTLKSNDQSGQTGTRKEHNQVDDLLGRYGR
jgi:hypothetical protein